VLNRRQRAVIEALVPKDGPAPLPGAFDANFEEFFARFEATALPSMRWGFAAGLWVAAWIAPALILKLPPITRLSTEDREAALEALGKSRIYLLRQMLLLLKAVVSFCYGANPKVRQALGVPS